MNRYALDFRRDSRRYRRKRFQSR